jgi:hypothetical protein
MRSPHFSYNHHWVRRKVQIEGKTVFHRQCIAFRRDFVFDCDVGCWRAVHVGLLGFDLLDEEISRYWLSEECPGQQLPEEINDRRMALDAPFSNRRLNTPTFIRKHSGAILRAVPRASNYLKEQSVSFAVARCAASASEYPLKAGGAIYATRE